jgi:hypothetical protein
MKKLVKPLENVNLQENVMEALCTEHSAGCVVNSADSETENDIVF